MFETGHSSVVEQRTVELRGYPWVVGSIPTGAEFLSIVSHHQNPLSPENYNDEKTISLNFLICCCSIFKISLSILITLTLSLIINQ